MGLPSLWSRADLFVAQDRNGLLAREKGMKRCLGSYHHVEHCFAHYVLGIIIALSCESDLFSTLEGKLIAGMLGCAAGLLVL